MAQEHDHDHEHEHDHDHLKIELRSASDINRPGNIVASSTGWVSEERIVRFNTPLRAVQASIYFLCVETYEPYLIWLQGNVHTIRVVSGLKSTIPVIHQHI